MAGSEAGSSEHELEELNRGFYHPHPPSPRHHYHTQHQSPGRGHGQVGWTGSFKMRAKREGFSRGRVLGSYSEFDTAGSFL